MIIMADRKKGSQIFREKSIERVSAPEQLDQYITVTKPSLWILTVSLLLMLIGALVWATFGRLDSSSVVGCKIEAGTVTTYITEAEYKKVKNESYIEINGKKILISEVTGPTLAGEESDTFLLKSTGIDSGEWYYTVICTSDLADGEYKGKVVYQIISPITFIFN